MPESKPNARGCIPPSRTITIVQTSRGFTIHEGEQYCPDLCWDEMLGSIAELTHPAIGGMRYAMLTPEQHAARRHSYRKHSVPEGLLLEGPQP